MAVVRFEKGDPVVGYWYICDRCFNKVKSSTLTFQDGIYVCPTCVNLDPMAETR
jgi:hypothetical protein